MTPIEIFAWGFNCGILLTTCVTVLVTMRNVTAELRRIKPAPPARRTLELTGTPLKQFVTTPPEV